jgi:hypothetical protein
MPIPLPVIPHTFRVALKWSQLATGQTAVNVIHLSNLTGTAAQSDVFEALDDAVTAAMWDACSANAAVSQVDVTPLDGTSATQTFTTGNPARWVGTEAGDFVPATAALVKLQTGIRGRQNRGRIFLPFIVESAQVNGALTSGEVATMQPAWTAFLASLAADSTAPGPWALVVASYDRKHAGAGAHENPAVAATVEAVLATQRRRQGRLR